MANIKSAKKRIKVSRRNEARNKSTKSKVKTYIKKVEQAAASGNKDEATKLLKEATKHINKAKSKGVYHKKNASRKVSRVARAVSKMK